MHATNLKNEELDTNEQSRIAAALDAGGYANLGLLLNDDEITAYKQMYARDDPFRNRVIMRRHNFGEGEYKYFDKPLPQKIQTLREELYTLLAPICNTWEKQLGTGRQFPHHHADFIERCSAGGQTRPTPLMLKYGAGDYNCLHQDLYGEHVFPLQVVILLSSADDFDGGEFVLTEQRPRMQSRVEVINLRPGHGVVFAVNERPKLGKRGFYRVRSRHGVSQIRRGERYTLGIIFHDAA